MCKWLHTHTHTQPGRSIYILDPSPTQWINNLFILWGFKNLNLANTTLHTCKDKSVLQHLRNHIMLLRLLHWWDPHTAQVPSNPKKIWPACRVFIRATWLLVPVVLLPVTPARPCLLCTPLHAVSWNQLRIKMLSLALKGIRTVRCLVEDNIDRK